MILKELQESAQQSKEDAKDNDTLQAHQAMKGHRQAKAALHTATDQCKDWQARAEAQSRRVGGGKSGSRQAENRIRHAATTRGIELATIL